MTARASEPFVGCLDYIWLSDEVCAALTHEHRAAARARRRTRIARRHAARHTPTESREKRERGGESLPIARAIEPECARQNSQATTRRARPCGREASRAPFGGPSVLARTSHGAASRLLLPPPGFLRCRGDEWDVRAVRPLPGLRAVQQGPAVPAPPSGAEPQAAGGGGDDDPVKVKSFPTADEPSDHMMIGAVLTLK